MVVVRGWIGSDPQQNAGLCRDSLCVLCIGGWLFQKKDQKIVLDLLRLLLQDLDNYRPVQPVLKGVGRESVHVLDKVCARKLAQDLGHHFCWEGLKPECGSACWRRLFCRVFWSADGFRGAQCRKCVCTQRVDDTFGKQKRASFRLTVEKRRLPTL